MKAQRKAEIIRMGGVQIDDYRELRTVDEILLVLYLRSQKYKKLFRPIVEELMVKLEKEYLIELYFEEKLKSVMNQKNSAYETGGAAVVGIEDLTGN